MYKVIYVHISAALENSLDFEQFRVSGLAHSLCIHFPMEVALPP